MPNESVLLRVWGDRAMFARPAFKTERVSYDFMPPSAARGFLEAIYWKPQMRWVVKSIRVMKPVAFASFADNAVARGVQKPRPSEMRGDPRDLRRDAVEDRLQRRSLYLRDVEYVIEAEVDPEGPACLSGASSPDGARKHREMFLRRARRGQFFRSPCLGTRECVAGFEPLDEPPPPNPDVPDADFGTVYHDAVYEPDDKGPIIESSSGRRCRHVAHFFHAVMRGGVVEVPPLPGRRNSL